MGVSRGQVPWLWGPHPSPMSFLRTKIVTYLPLTHSWHREGISEYEVSSTGARTGRTRIERDVLFRETEMKHLPRGCAVASRQELGRAHRPLGPLKLRPGWTCLLFMLGACLSPATLLWLMICQ